MENADFYVLHKLQTLLLTCILQSSRSENFGKFQEKCPWWTTVLAMLLT